MFDDRVITPRDYQAKAVADTLAAFDAGDPGVLIRLPTGTGKTITAGLIVKNWLRRSPQHRVMVLCHEIQLIDQFAKELWDVAGYTAAIEQGARRANGRESKLVIASRNTLAERVVGADDYSARRVSRLGKFDWKQPWLVVVDEAHKYSRSLKTCGHVFDWFAQNPNSRRLGITATPWRTDKISLGTLFPHVAVDYRLMTFDGTPNAVEDGWCVPYEQHYVVVEDVDFKQMKSSCGDWSDDDLARLLAETRTLAKYVDPTLELVGDRPTLIFCPTVDMAKTVSAYVNARLGRDCARELDGAVSHDERRTVYQQFEAGAFQFLTVCGLCLAKGTKVLTDVGEVAIEDVTTDMRVWDGVEFVQHDGVVSKGVKTVMEYAGLMATPEHNLWTGSTWKTMAECADGGLHIAIGGSGADPVHESRGAFRRGDDSWWRGNREVFDILNAGPRHRFTANGLIVSNCREGYDNPSIGAVAIFRPTKSTSLLEQMCGRGCRPLRGTLEGLQTPPERRAAIASSRKPTCLIVNLTGSTGLAGAATAAKCYLDGLPDDVVARTEAKMTQGVKNVGDALRDVQAEIAEEERQKEKARERRERDAQRRRERAQRQADLDAQVQYSSHVIDPYSGVSVQSSSSFGSGSMATEKQLRVLWRAGISASPDKLTKKEAGMLVGMVIGGTSRQAIQSLARKLQDGQKKQQPVASQQAAPAAGRANPVSPVPTQSPPASTEPDWGQVFPLFRQ